MEEQSTRRRADGFRTCEACGALFYVSPSTLQRAPSRWCSTQCAGKGRRRGQTKICETCGASFYVLPSRTWRRFCSKKCGGVAIRTGVLTSCQHCGTSFLAKPSHLARGIARYCSAACYGLAQQRPTRRTCPECGVAFTRFDHRKTRFCSRACWVAYARTHPEATPNYRGGREPYYGPNWPTQARLTRQRDNFTCQDCGLTRRHPRLPVHHIAPRRLFAGNFIAANALSNLVTLCDGCHNRRERALDKALFR